MVKYFIDIIYSICILLFIYKVFYFYKYRCYTSIILICHKAKMWLKRTPNKRKKEKTVFCVIFYRIEMKSLFRCYVTNILFLFLVYFPLTFSPYLSTHIFQTTKTEMEKKILFIYLTIKTYLYFSTTKIYLYDAYYVFIRLTFFLYEKRKVKCGRFLNKHNFLSYKFLESKWL